MENATKELELEYIGSTLPATAVKVNNMNNYIKYNGKWDLTAQRLDQARRHVSRRIRSKRYCQKYYTLLKKTDSFRFRL